MATRTWLITGSSRGFGRAIAEAALEAGNNVVLTARSVSALKELAQHYGDRALAVPLDVTDADASHQAVRWAVDRFGRLDVVVNNAGFADSGSIEDTPPEEFRSQIETNLFGVYNVTRAALPVLRRQRSGHFLQFSSIGGRVGGTAGIAAYQTAKFGVEGFSQVLHTETAPLGIKVTIVEPGAFRTDWAGSSMRTFPVSADYDATVGEMNRWRAINMQGNEAGDPARAAKILLDIVDHPNPPLRLLLGAGAVAAAEKASMERAAEAAEWAPISRAADFPPGEE